MNFIKWTAPIQVPPYLRTNKDNGEFHRIHELICAAIDEFKTFSDIHSTGGIFIDPNVRIFIKDITISELNPYHTDYECINIKIHIDSSEFTRRVFLAERFGIFEFSGVSIMTRPPGKKGKKRIGKSVLKRVRFDSLFARYTKDGNEVQKIILKSICPKKIIPTCMLKPPTG